MKSVPVLRRKERDRRLPASVLMIGALAVAACANAQTVPSDSPTLEASLLTVEEVRAISGLDQLSAEDSPVATEPQPDPTAPGPCKALLDQRVVFGMDVTQFRAVSFGAATDTAPGQIRGVAIVTQAIGQFPSADAARAAFDELPAEIRRCKDLRVKNYEYVADQPDENTLMLSSNVAEIVNHVQGSTLIHVTVVGTDDSERTAANVMREISSRVG